VELPAFAEARDCFPCRFGENIAHVLVVTAQRFIVPSEIRPRSRGLTIRFRFGHVPESQHHGAECRERENQINEVAHWSVTPYRLKIESACAALPLVIGFIRDNRKASSQTAPGFCVARPSIH
jgi:hypothetical protein